MAFKKAHMKDLSSVHPDIYADRFYKFMKDEVFASIKRKNLFNQMDQERNPSFIPVNVMRDSNKSL